MLAELLVNVSANLAKTHILHFCTLQIQYHIEGVPNFFLGSIFSISTLKKEKENIPLKVAAFPQVTLFLQVI